MENSKIKDFKKRVIQILDRYLGDDYLLFVFGSCAREGLAGSSDIDLAVYREVAIPAGTIVEAKESLEEGAGTLRDIDLVNLTDQNTGTKLLGNILKEGIIWKEAKNSGELLRSLKERLLNSRK